MKLNAEKEELLAKHRLELEQFSQTANKRRESTIHSQDSKELIERLESENADLVRKCEQLEQDLQVAREESASLGFQNKVSH